MDFLYTSGIRFAEMFQTSFNGPPEFWLWVTFLGDPKCIFIIYFPLAYFLLDQKVGVKVLWLGLISEWLNLVSKWLLFGERPFWWMYESGFFHKGVVFPLQSSATCETGPGSPSGHCMITGAALWPIMNMLTQRISQHSKSCMARMVPLAAYLLLLLAVGLSRIFILAHFPHQVVGGIVAGIILGWLLESWAPQDRGLQFYLWVSMSLLLSTLMTYWTLVALGVDLAWSIKLATKWCVNPMWIRMDTRPFASLCRDVATALGLGLALHFRSARLKHERLGWPCRAWCALLALIILCLLSDMRQQQEVALWYGLAFVKYATFPWMVVVLVPKIVLAVTSRATPPHKE